MPDVWLFDAWQSHRFDQFRYPRQTSAHVRGQLRELGVDLSFKVSTIHAMHLQYTRYGIAGDAARSGSVPKGLCVRALTDSPPPDQNLNVA
jgi:hypothetical protein